MLIKCFSEHLLIIVRLKYLLTIISLFRKYPQDMTTSLRICVLFLFHLFLFFKKKKAWKRTRKVYEFFDNISIYIIDVFFSAANFISSRFSSPMLSKNPNMFEPSAIFSDVRLLIHIWIIFFILKYSD